jgi:predicted glycosyltransferase
LARLRLLFYSHDTYGLGHLRRSLALARYFRRRWPDASQLIVTGSPLAEGYWLPEGADYVKLPSVVKVGAGRYASRSLAASFEDVRALRRDLLFAVARKFEPDALIVDHAPAGLKGEALATLRYLKRESGATALVLGLRDIVDEAPRVRRDWTREGVYDLLDQVYDRILVYGTPDIYDPVAEYGFSDGAAHKSRYVGYLRREADRPPPAIRRELGLRTDRLVLVTPGGGGDGHELCRVLLQALRLSSGRTDFDCVVVTGPLMPEEWVRQLEGAAKGLPAVRILRFVGDLAGHIAAADAVVAMAGHNSVSEILSFGRPSVLVPRVTPRREQLVRAEALSRRGFVRMLNPADLTPRRLLGVVHDLLGDPHPVEPPFALDGLPSAAAELEELLGERAWGRVSSTRVSPRREELRIAGSGRRR